jgi:mannose-1-phosphate guanylyltransferase
MLADQHVWVTILAGGVGSRFWPVSTPDRPKQLLPLASERPLIVDTVERARTLVPDDRIRILAGDHLAGPFQRVLPDLGSDSYWIEPRARGTCPVLAWAAWQLVRLDPEAVMVSLHADHLIRPVERLEETLETAVEVARRDQLLLSVGVEPDRPETGYGYVAPGELLPSAGGVTAHRGKAFHEKPSSEVARRYIDEGYLWNTGIFIWKAALLLEEINRHAPEVAKHLGELETSAEAFFDAVPVSVVDRAVMERSGRIGTVTASFEWDDVGSWEALSRTRTGDVRGNILLGDAQAVEADGNIVFSESGGVVLFGTQDLVVVRTGEQTVVMPRDRAPDLKALLEQLDREGP